MEEESQNLEAQSRPASQSSETPTLVGEPTASKMVDNDTFPKIPIDLRQHKRPIAISFAVLITCGSFIPVLLYFVLKYPGGTKPTIYLSIPTVVFGVSSLFSMYTRIFRLTKKENTFRPINGGRWSLDFFQINFIITFCVVTAMIVVSVGLGVGKELPRLTSFPQTFLLWAVCTQLFLVNFLVLNRVHNPVRISSVQTDDLVRPAVYTIVEDVVAVDANQGLAFREVWDARYRASPGGEMKRLLVNLSWVWGGGGMAIAAVNTGLIFGLKNLDAVYVVGWTVPWVWAGLTTLFTFWYVEKALQRERAKAGGHLGEGTMR